jgi:hypothetical protein
MSSGLALIADIDGRCRHLRCPNQRHHVPTTDFKRHGASAIEKVRKQQPAAYMKICALLVPREMKVEHSGGVKAMTDEQLEQGIEAIRAMLAAREAGENAKVIEGVAEPAPEVEKVAKPTKRKRRATPPGATATGRGPGVG